MSYSEEQLDYLAKTGLSSRLGTCTASLNPHPEEKYCIHWKSKGDAALEQRQFTSITRLDWDEVIPPTLDLKLNESPVIEKIVTDPETGGRKGTKPARFDLLPPDVLSTLAEHYAKGAEKYDDHNWRQGYAWSLSFAALMRHAWAFWGGEDIDPETGSPHLAAVLFHAAAMLHYLQNGKGTDDRPSA